MEAPRRIAGLDRRYRHHRPSSEQAARCRPNEYCGTASRLTLRPLCTSGTRRTTLTLGSTPGGPAGPSGPATPLAFNDCNATAIAAIAGGMLVTETAILPSANKVLLAMFSDSRLLSRLCNVALARLVR